jgi:hypothetical protein
MEQETIMKALVNCVTCLKTLWLTHSQSDGNGILLTSFSQCGKATLVHGVTVETAIKIFVGLYSIHMSFNIYKMNRS